MSIAKNNKELRFEWDMKDAGYHVYRVKSHSVLYGMLAANVLDGSFQRAQEATPVRTYIDRGINAVGMYPFKPLKPYVWVKKKVWLCKPAKGK